MKVVNMGEAKTQLPRRIAAIERGEDVVITRAGKPVARLVRFSAQAAAATEPDPIVRKSGGLKGKIWIADDFDAPLPGDTDGEHVVKGRGANR